MHFTRTLLLITVGVLLCTSLTAQAIIKADQQTFNNIGNQVEYLEDKEGTLQFSEVVQHTDQFKTGTQSVFNFGITHSAYWFRLRYTLLQGSAARLVIDKPNIDSIQVYVPQQNNYAKYFIPHSGSGKNTFYVSSSYVFDLPSADSAVVYIRIRTSNIMIVPIKLAAEPITDDALIKRTAWQGVYGGILFILFLVSLLVFFRLKDRLYLYYSMYVFCLGAYVLMYLGGFGKILHLNFNGILGEYSFVLGLCGFTAAGLFGQRFLDLQQHAPRVNTFLNAVIVLLLSGLAVSMVVGRSLGIPLVQLLGLVVTLTLLVSGIILLFKGVYTARFYVLAWGTLLTALVYTLLSYQGVIPFNDFSLQAVIVGSTLELCFLSVAIADRMKSINEQRQLAILENVRLQEQHTHELEAEVLSRTQDLQLALETIQSDKNAKDDLFRIVVHDVRSPLAGLYQMIELVESGIMTREEFDAFIPELKKNTSQVLDTISMLLQWVMVQKQGSNLEKENIRLAPLFEEHVRLYAQLMTAKNIRSTINCLAGIQVFADRNQLSLILRNLVDNAIKFTPQSGQIKLAADLLKEGTRISVFNTAASLSEQMIHRLQTDSGLKMSKGTAEEKGIGLGLQLCREFLVKMNSQLQVRNVDGGIEFSFVIK